MKSTVKFVYSDLAGVFFHWKIGVRALADSLGSSEERIWEIFDVYDKPTIRGEIGPQELWGKYLSELNLAQRPEIDFVEQWVGSFKRIEEGHKLIKGLAKTYPIGLLTNIYDGSYQRMVEKKLVPGEVRFEPIVQSCYVQMVKPDREIFELAQSMIPFNKDEVLFIDDSAENLRAGREFGWQVFEFDDENPGMSLQRFQNDTGIILS